MDVAADEVMAWALAWIEFYRQRSVPYLVVSHRPSISLSSR